jgi:hypothetical protein
MSQGFGHELPAQHTHQVHRQITRYLILISAGEVPVARLFLGSREQAAEFDATSEEVTTMTRGLSPTRDAMGSEWDRALAGHSAEERAGATIYALEL